MKVELLRANIGDAKELKHVCDKILHFTILSVSDNKKLLHRKQSGCVKKCMETEIGN